MFHIIIPCGLDQNKSLTIQAGKLVMGLNEVEPTVLIQGRELILLKILDLYFISYSRKYTFHTFYNPTVFLRT